MAAVVEPDGELRVAAVDLQGGDGRGPHGPRHATAMELRRNGCGARRHTETMEHGSYGARRHGQPWSLASPAAHTGQGARGWGWSWRLGALTGLEVDTHSAAVEHGAAAEPDDMAGHGARGWGWSWILGGPTTMELDARALAAHGSSGAWRHGRPWSSGPVMAVVLWGTDGHAARGQWPWSSAASGSRVAWWRAPAMELEAGDGHGDC